MCSCAQVLSQGFKQHLGWCKGTRKEAQDEGEDGDEEEADEEEGDTQEVAAIEASKVLTAHTSRFQAYYFEETCNIAMQHVHQ